MRERRTERRDGESEMGAGNDGEGSDDKKRPAAEQRQREHKGE